MRGLPGMTYLLSLVRDLSLRTYSTALCRSLLAALVRWHAAIFLRCSFYAVLTSSLLTYRFYCKRSYRRHHCAMPRPLLRREGAVAWPCAPAAPEGVAKAPGALLIACSAACASAPGVAGKRKANNQIRAAGARAGGAPSGGAAVAVARRTDRIL